MWNEEASLWFGGEQDIHADGVEEVAGWHEAIHGGWIGGEDLAQQEVEAEEDDAELGQKRAIDEVDEVEQGVSVKRTKSRRGRRKA